MALRTILHFPDPRLRTQAKPVTVFDKELRRLIDDEPYRQRLGDAARQRAAALPSWEESAGRLFAMLRAVAYGDRRGSP